MASRRDFLKLTGFAAAGLIGATQFGSVTAKVSTKQVGGLKQFGGKQPNFLIMMVDQQRSPMPYESLALKAFRDRYLLTQNALAQCGMTFEHHYAGATACSPSRASLYTGQYPSLHGVSNTTGAAKSPFDPDVFWLEPDSVPTFGHYFQQAGYQTYWKGKWHASDRNLLIPNTKDEFPSYDTTTGQREPDKEALYLDANRLGPYGFNGWIGPEPHGANPLDSGSSPSNGRPGRDAGYADQVVSLIQQLDAEQSEDPWLIMSSFVNPHDIALWGLFANLSGAFEFGVGPEVPLDLFNTSLFSQSRNESLEDKPTAQLSYRDSYSTWLQPIFVDEQYFRFYYQLHKTVDEEMRKVYRALLDSSFFENTIVVFLSDHGELLSAHGDMHQKWYTSYEESIHVPFIISNPVLFPEPVSLNAITSHVDFLPTLLGLAGLEVEPLLEQFGEDFTDPLMPVGRNLAGVVTVEVDPATVEDPIYFMTDDDPARGLNMQNFIGIPSQSVAQPNHLETVITRIDGDSWKFTRYFDNPQFWSDPGTPGDSGVRDVVVRELFPDLANAEAGQETLPCERTVKLEPESDQFELYNLTQDPMELSNLAGDASVSSIQRQLGELLEQQCEQKRLHPVSGTVPGQLGCSVSDRSISLKELQAQLALK